MTDSSSTSETPLSTPSEAQSGTPEPQPPSSPAAPPPPSYVKLAMRNMVKKGGTSLYHFGLTALGLLGLLVGLAYITR